MDRKTLKELTVKAIREYWESVIGRDFDSGPSKPDWEEIRKIMQSVREYDHDPETCNHEFAETMWGEEKGLTVCQKCGIIEPEEQEDDY